MKATVYKDHAIDTSAIDRDALSVIHRLQQEGFRTYLVGGSVRDLLLNRAPKDFDISTSAHPQEIKKVFGRQCLLIGRRFVLAHIRFGHKIIEVATFRAGDNIWGSEEEDAMRRDFTINGLFYDSEHHQVIDYVGGWNDLHEHTLRTIGEPELRFNEDPVRMLRLLKFQARFAFKAAPEVSLALAKCLPEISKSSSARILEEIFKMLESCSSGRFFELLMQSGMLHVLFPQLYATFNGPKKEMLFGYLQAVDQVNKQARRYPIERAVLTSAILFPLFEDAIKAEFLDCETVPHFGEVMGVAQTLIKSFFISAFSHFPRRISAIMTYVLSMQYRLTPIQQKRQHPTRLFKVREFPLALRLLKVRAYVNPELQKAYISWREMYRQFLRHEDHPHSNRYREHHARKT